MALSGNQPTFFSGVTPKGNWLLFPHIATVTVRVFNKLIQRPLSTLSSHTLSVSIMLEFRFKLAFRLFLTPIVPMTNLLDKVHAVPLVRTGHVVG
jgi:hypothetical protein